MSESDNIGNWIQRTPGVRGGRPCVAGTGILVKRIVIWTQMGWPVEKIARELPHLPVAGIQAALAYYKANHAEINADIASENELARKLEKDHAVIR